MRFKKFLNEYYNFNSEPDDEPEYDDGFDMKHFMKDVKFYKEQFPEGKVEFMWHGTSDAPESWELLTFRPRKHPQGTPRPVHDAVNEYFASAFKWSFRDGLFATGRKTTAESYGKLCLLVPSGPFEWLCAPKVEDMTEFASELGDDPEAVVDALHEETWYHNKNLTAAIKSDSEIMLKPLDFYLISDKDNISWIMDRMNGK